MKLVGVLFCAGYLLAQGLDPSTLLKSGAGNWPTYYGDYTGRQFGSLSQINKDNVNSLTVAWVFKTNAAPPPTFEAALDRPGGVITSVPVEVNGILYFTAPDHVWALDARTGRVVWHFYRPSPGTHAVNRGAAIYKNQIYFGTPDAHVISIDARTGKKLWDVALGDVTLGQAVTMAPLVTHTQSQDRLIVGSSGDGADVPGFVVALDPNNGQIRWRWDAVPKSGERGANTWGSGKIGEDIMAHGGGNPSMTPTYDPDLNFIYVGTGSPRPALAGDARPGSNLYTCSIVALNADTGQLAWAFQTSPHDTHHWDAIETPVLVDGDLKGKQRKLLMQASRNGYFFVLDRTTGENLLSVPFVNVNWSAGVDAKGQPIPKTSAEPRSDGVLVSPGELGATSSAPPSFSSQTHLLYVNARSPDYAMFYKTSSGGVAKGIAGFSREVGSGGFSTLAIDYTNGKVRWKAKAGGLGGVLTTAGGLAFTSGPQNNVVALNAENGAVLWHAKIGTISSSAITYEVNRRQYILTPVGDMLYAWTLPNR